MKRQAIERLLQVTPAEFSRNHLQGLGKPTIITDAAKDWPALRKWSFAYFRQRYGGDFLPISLGLMSPAAKFTRLSSFIDYVDTPSQPLAGFWVDAKELRALREGPDIGEARHYLVDWHAFRRHPELRADIVPSPYFMSDLESALSPELRDVLEDAFGHEYSSVFVGPEGTLSRLHQDYAHTYTSLTQIRGRKRAILFSPADSDFLYGGKIDPEQPDFETFGQLAEATAYECVLEQGEMLFIPPDWWHWVKALDPSITMSHCYFNELNLRHHLGCILQKPGLVSALVSNPEWCKALNVEWRNEGLHPAEGRGSP